MVISVKNLGWWRISPSHRYHDFPFSISKNLCSIQIVWSFKMAPRVKRCFYDNCRASSETHPNLRFYNFPAKLKERWVSACNNPDLLNVTSSNLIKHHYVCNKHFLCTHYRRILSPFKTQKRLKSDAIPISAVKDAFIGKLIPRIWLFGIVFP